MQAYRIHQLVIAADIPQEAHDFYRQEIDGALPDAPDAIEELPVWTEVCCDDGSFKTVKARINEELDTRNAWLNMGVPCDLHWPFVIGTMPERADASLR
jgi:hypothetical protein